MTIRTHIALGTALLAISGAAVAQSSDVTIRVPLNLTQLAADISRLRVQCSVTSDAFGYDSGGRRIYDAPSGERVINVSNGRVVTTLDVLVPISSSQFVGPTIGQGASYECVLDAFSTSQQQWDVFSLSHSNPAYRVVLSPVISLIQGSFTW
jgi:hypothetical protein